MRSTKYIVLGIVLSLSLSLSARMYVAGESIFLDPKMKDEIGNWSKDGAKLYLYFFQSTDVSHYEWVSLSPIDASSTGKKVFAGTMSAYHSWYDKVIVIRGTGANWSSVWNQTCDIDIPDANDNYLHVNNCSDGDKWHWYIYSPFETAIGSFVAGEAADEIHVCPASKGDPIALRPKLKSDKSGYMYEEVKASEWYYSADGTNWTSLRGYGGATRSGEDITEKDLFTTLPNEIDGGVYYYLFSSIPAGRHLFYIKADAPKCELDCEITSLETAVSNVNADNNTYTLDGIVAFGKANGELVVECDGHSISFPAPQSPQAFSLMNVPAATTNGVTTSVHAYFTGDAACDKSIIINVPNATEAVQEFSRDILTGEAITLTPADAEDDNDYVWIVDDKEYRKSDGQAQNFSVPAFGKAGTQTYIYKEYYPLSGTMDDMMANGGYEENNSDGKYGSYGTVGPMSEYNYWGYFDQTATTQIDFYDNTATGINPLGLKENGFAVVQNAHHFYPTYASVKAKEGIHFAMFDAKTGAEGGNKKAWRATTANNANLILKKGTTYVLSFWAANINNYGEMDNAARFQFRIEYNGHVWNSAVLDLSDPKYRNNIWHQHSETFYADEDCNDVTISVVNLNTNSLHIGNDFALDDIQFHAISTVTKVVKSQQQFTVRAHEPKINGFTASVVPLACNGGPAYTVRMHVEFLNPKGNLVIRDHTTGIDSVFTVSTPFETPTSLDKDFIVTTNDPVHNWEVFFDGWPAASKSAATDIPGFPSMKAKNFTFESVETTCSKSTVLRFDLDYTYQQGILHYSILGLAGDSVRMISTDKNQQQLTGLSFEGIPADGQTRTLRVMFDGKNSCSRDYTLPATPFSPVIDKFDVKGIPAGQLSCDTTFYVVNAEVTTHFDADGYTIQLDYIDGGSVMTATKAATGTKTVIPLTLHNMDEAPQTITARILEIPSCPANSTYTPPTRAQITPEFDVTVSETACGTTNYSVSGTVAFEMADGDLVVEYDDAHRQVIVTPTSPAPFHIDNMTATGNALRLKAWFTGSATNACTVTSKAFASPIVPQMAVEDTIYASAVCGSDSTTLTFNLRYTYQQGTLHYSVDALPEKSAVISEKNASEQIFPGLNYTVPADGLPHTLNVRCDGPNSCEETVALPAAPLTPQIKAVAVSGIPATVLCDEAAYNAKVAIYMPYDATGKNIVLSYEGKNMALPVSGNPTIAVVPLTATGATGLKISAHYEDATACVAESAPYNAPLRLSCVKDTAVICEGESFQWPYNNTTYGPFYTAGKHIVTDAVNEHDTLIIFVRQIPEITLQKVDTLYDDITAITLPFTIDKGQPDSFHIAVGGYTFEQKYAGSAIVIDRPADMTAGAYTANVTVYDSLISCFSSAQVQFVIAGIPTVSALTVTPREAFCGATTYEADVHIEYSNPRGYLILEDKTNHITHTYPVPAVPFNTPQTLDTVVTIGSFVPASLSWEAYFTGWASATVTSEAPSWPVIDTVIVSGIPANILCDEVTYNANIAVYMPYDATGKNIVLNYEGKNMTIPVAGNPTIAVVPLTATGATGLTVSAHYEDAPACVAESAPYNAPIRLSCVKDTAVICEGESFLWPHNNTTYGPFYTAGKHIVTDAANEHDTLVIFVRQIPEITLLKVDTLYDDITAVTLPFTIDKGKPDSFHIAVGGYTFEQKYAGPAIVIERPADMTAGAYTADITVYDSLISCFSSTQVQFVIAGIPTVSALTVTPREAFCGATTYEADVHIEYSNPRGYLILEDKTNHITHTYPVPAVPFNTPQTLDTVVTIGSFVPASLSWEAYFTGRASATATSEAPVVPDFDTVNVAFSSLACTDLSATLTFDLRYTNQQGTLTYQVDALPAQTATYSVADKTTQTLSGLTVSDIPADGKIHTLYVSFDDANSCVKSFALPQIPLSSVISSLTVTKEKDKVLCNEDSVKVTVTVTIPYDAIPSAANIKVSYPGGDDLTIPVAGSTQKTFTLENINIPVGDAPVVFTAEYQTLPGTVACPVTYTLAMPVRLTCDKEYADICLGESYTWHGNTFTPAAAGAYEYKDNYDSLYLTVHSEPAIRLLPAAIICENAGQIRLPFMITEGTPNRFDIRIEGQTFTQERGVSDTIVLARPETVSAGRHTAVITVRDTFVTCSSTVETEFVIADPDRMYRKWDDLVFIDNSENLFTAYQWYKNGLLLEGETAQYYFDPNRMSGTDTYFCRMVTATNDTLYSCETAFEDIVRSRDKSQEATQNISVSPTYIRTSGTIIIRQSEEEALTISVLDATGKLLGVHMQNEATGTISAPDQQGMYVVRVEGGDVVQTVKIIVHE